ncbi:MAG: hypothetical protein ACOY4K_12450 [Pseudomonadota bacterium]
MRLIVSAAAVAALSLAACGKKDEERRPGVAPAPGGFSVTGQDGATATVSTSAAAATAALPAFAPLYPGGAIEGSVAGVSRSDAEASGGTATFTTPDPPQKVIAFYKARTQAAGLKTEGEVNMGAALMLVARDDATDRGLQVMASNQAGKTSVTLFWATPK